MDTILLGILVAMGAALLVLAGLLLNRVAAEGRAQREETHRLLSDQRAANALMGDAARENQRTMIQALNLQLAQMENRIKSLEAGNELRLENMRNTIEKRLSSIQEDNNKRLDEMRKTVDEKLQKSLETKLNESFRLVSERLEQVYKGLGEMQTLAVGVGDLKKVLSNVKTRGILGEIQLGAILEEMLSPEQYETNVQLNPKRALRVEYAIKLPADGEKCVYLPIDAKFPGEAYLRLQDAYESGSPQAVQLAAAELSATLRKSAKDIRDKYIDPPFTTDFAIMFLPTEGLYAEAVNRGMVEVLQRESRVSLAGPSTMAALLNSLQMGFRTLAIQRRSSEVWELLSAVKTDFEKFHEVLSKTQTRLRQADQELETLVGTRTNVIMRRLKGVQSLEETRARALLEDEPAEAIDEDAQEVL